MLSSQQIVFIHGGDTFATHDEYLAFLRDFEIDPPSPDIKKWKHSLIPKLGDSFELLAPEMPSKSNAKYSEWAIWFKKFIPYFKLNTIFIGHSLGGLFLAKYLSENTLPAPIRAAFLVAAPFDDEHADYSLADFTLPANLSLLTKQVPEIFLYHSIDDPVVLFQDFEKYVQALPTAHVQTFTDRSHFNQPEFPELIKDIQLVSK